MTSPAALEKDFTIGIELVGADQETVHLAQRGYGLPSKPG
jgi:hypothetical protein